MTFTLYLCFNIQPRCPIGSLIVDFISLIIET
jgi:hypothetical protein